MALKNDTLGLYSGIVINVNDPEQKGRVQVYIPSLDPVPGKTWVSRFFSWVFPGNDNGGDMNLQNIKELRETCAWAYICVPLFGGSSIGRMDEKTGMTTVSDSATELKEFQFMGMNHGALSQSTNMSVYSSNDAFVAPTANYVTNANYSGYDYNMVSLADAPKGIMGSVGFGTKVLVGFFGGNKSQPIIIGKLPMAREAQLLQE